MEKKRLLTIFPALINVHLAKDVGMIPFILHKELGYDSTVATYKNGDYIYLDNEVKGIKLSFISKITGVSLLDGMIYMLLNLNKFDILQVYHFSPRSIIWCFFFKIVKLGRCKTYLKLDAGDDVKKVRFTGLGMKLLEYFLSTVDLVTIETTQIQEVLNNNWKRKVEYIPNGFYDYGIREEVPFAYKENLIITVGRIGTVQKDTGVLCEAFAKFAMENKDWGLKIIGPIDPRFIDYAQKYTEKYPHLKNRVEFTGDISDRKVLNKLYKKAKIFVLTSKEESFGLVYLEAMSSGCYVISSAITPAYDLIDNEQYGKLFPVGDINALTDKIFEVTQDSELMESVSQKAQKYVYNQFYWIPICEKIDKLLYSDN